MKETILLFLAVLLICPTQAQKNNIVNIHFEGMEFDNLNLVVLMDDENRTKISFAGQTENGKDWMFVYPDSLYDKHSATEVRVPIETDTLVGSIAFKAIIDQDTLRAASYCFSRGVSNIQAVYLKTEDYSVGKQYQFLVSSQSDRQLLASIEAIGYKYSFPNSRDSIMYEYQLNLYEGITKKYPNSHFLSYLLANTLIAYKTKSDIDRLFSCFSYEVKQSNNGNKINDYLASHDTRFEYNEFENSVLPEWNSKKPEPIIQDSSKFNLVIFSASWCRYCHEQIPLLKDLYSNYKDNILLTYISMDEEKYLEYWSDLMIQKNIPWRSLLAMYNLQEIKDRYIVEGIPHSILVYPEGKKAEILNVSIDTDYNKIIELIKQ